MEKEYYMNSSMPSLQYEQTMPMWNSLTSEQPMDYFMNPSWENHHNHHLLLHKSTENDQYSSHLSSALTSMVMMSSCSSSPAAMNESFALRGLVGKFENSGSVGPPFPPMSPPCSTTPVMDHIMSRTARRIPHPLPALSADPGFVERAARFSCFGSRSLNGRISQLGCNNGEWPHRSVGKLARVVSSPVLAETKNWGRPIAGIGLKNNGSVSDFGRLHGSGANSNESSVSEQAPSGETGEKAKAVAAPSGELNPRKRKTTSRGKIKEDATNQAAEAFKDDNVSAKRSKPTEWNGSENNGGRTEEPAKSNATGAAEESKKPPEPPKDYIHVRARRGQATDSHSLAERVRREKISERMKLLQDLVPGCNKVTGKALMLDEIINYVQALQRRVEFLSMKLASVNPRMDFELDNLISKDVFQPNASSLPQPIYPFDSSAAVIYGHNNNNTSGMSGSHCPAVDPLCHNIGIQLPTSNGFGEGLPQFAALCEDELQSIVQMGLPNGDLPFPSQGFSEQASQMKVEM